MAQYAKCRVIDVADKFPAAGNIEMSAKERAAAKKDERRYSGVIVEVLGKIESTNIGKALFASLGKHGQPIVIAMPNYKFALMSRANCSSSALARSFGDDLFRRPILSGAESIETLQATLLGAIKAGGRSYAAVASYMVNAIGLTGRKPQRPVTEGELKGLLETNAASFKTSIDRNRFFEPLREFPFAYYLKVAVEADLPRGPGAGTSIQFDPWNTL